jgi:hypothetical protein
MLERLSAIINSVYLTGRQDGPDYFILEEDANTGKVGRLDKITLCVRDVANFSVYKFDQKVIVNGSEYETYAPFLSDSKGVRIMCDFIVFFQMKADPKPIYTWVLNMKSGTDSNNLRQMRAGRCIAQFLLSKLDDALKEQDQPANLNYAGIKFVLFSIAPGQKAGTNPLLSKLKSAAINALQPCARSGDYPETFIRQIKKAAKLEPQPCGH